MLIAFPQQQWLRERASMLPFTYIACLVRDFVSMLADVKYESDYAIKFTVILELLRCGVV